MNEIQHKRLNGVVYTPDKVAQEVTRIGLQSVSFEVARVLEPSAGDGVFLRALFENGVFEDRITAVDVDGEATRALEDVYDEATIVEADFIEYALWPDIGKFDLIVGNPPFIKRVAYGTTFKDNLWELAAVTGFPASELKNAWAAFVVAAAHVLTDDGVLALVLPYELINVKYGRSVQLFLFQNGFSVEIFVPDKKAFPKLEQDAVVLLAQRNEKKEGKIQVHRVDSCDKLNARRSAAVDVLHENEAAIDVKSVLLDSETIELLHKLRKDMPSIVDYCGSAPGIVTAANDFFILTDSEVADRELSPWARRILKKGSYLTKSPIFGKDDLDRIAKTKPCNLIDFFSMGSPELSKAAIQYITECKEERLHERYKCQQRKPWYRIPIVEAGDGLFFKRAHILPRLCVNEAGVLVTDTAYQIRMKDDFRIRDLCFSFYNSVSLLFAEIKGRFYGGGVLELTPEEFRGLPLTLLNPSEEEFEEFVKQISAPTGQSLAALGYGDNQVRMVLGISERQMNGIRNALKSLREHRLRHAAYQTNEVCEAAASVDAAA